jgi:hypothetical protein
LPSPLELWKYTSSAASSSAQVGLSPCAVKHAREKYWL